MLQAATKQLENETTGGANELRPQCQFQTQINGKGRWKDGWMDRDCKAGEPLRAMLHNMRLHH